MFKSKNKEKNICIPCKTQLYYIKEGCEGYKLHRYVIMILTIFQVSMTPYLPAISVFVNIFLMLRLSEATWVRFAVWMAIGLYFFTSPAIYLYT